MAGEELDKAATPSSSGAPILTGMTSGTASEAMIRAAMSSSSEDTPAAGTPSATEVPADTSGQADGSEGEADSLATRDATGPRDLSDPEEDPSTPAQTPPHRIEAAVRNARDKATAAVEAKYAWAKDFTADDARDLKTALQLMRALNDDAKGFSAQLNKELGAHDPQPKVEEVEEDYPQGDLQTTDGSQRAYSVDALRRALDVHAKKVRATIMKELAPVVETVNGDRQAREQASIRAAAQERTLEAMKEARDLPHFKEHEADIEAYMRTKMTPQAIRQLGAIGAMHFAYGQVLKETVFPTIKTDAERDVRGQFQKKVASGQGSVHPTSAPGDRAKVSINSVGELSRHMERLAEGMAQ